MAPMGFLLAAYFFSYGSHAIDYCSGPNDRNYYCKFTGERYPQQCPVGAKLCPERNQWVCICKTGFYRKHKGRVCVPLRDCVLPERNDFKILSSPDTLFVAKASSNVFFTNIMKCFKSSFRASRGSGRYRTLEFQERTATLSIRKEPSTGGVDARSVDQPSINEGLEDMANSTNPFPFDITFSEWKKKNYDIALTVSVVNGRHILRINEHNPSSIPPGLEPAYDVLHVDSQCLIIGTPPPAGVRTDCVYWTPLNRVGQTNEKCDFIFKHYCRMPTDISDSYNECL